MLYQKNGNTFSPWVGAPVDDVLYPLNIEQLWSDGELAAINLYRLVTPDVPAGKVVTGQSVENVNGLPTVVYTLADAPLPDLAPYQFFSMLELSGKKAALDAFINALPAPANIVARAKLDRSLVFHRDNDLVLAAQQALGLTDQQLDTLWLQAAAL